VWIACRHHVFEVMLAAVFSAALGPSSGPDIELFQRFRKRWPCIDQSDFHVPGPEIFDGISDIQRTEMLSFYTEALKSKAVRDDYHELLQLCYIFLGGSLDGNLRFRAPGALHRARWMAKAIYSLCFMSNLIPLFFICRLVHRLRLNWRI
jgi:hypothetical protein